MEYDSPTESTVGDNSDAGSFVDTDKENDLLVESFCHVTCKMYFDSKIDYMYRNQGGITFWCDFKQELIKKYYQYKLRQFTRNLLNKNKKNRLLKLKNSIPFSNFIDNLIIQKRLQEFNQLKKCTNQLIFKKFIDKLLIKIRIEKIKKIGQLNIIAHEESLKKTIMDTISEVSNKETTGSNISDRQFDFDPYSFLKTPTKKKDPYFRKTGKTKYPKKISKPPIPKIDIKENTTMTINKQKSYVPYVAMGAGILAMIFTKIKST